MTHLTKTDCESILEPLRDKTLSFGCVVMKRDCGTAQVVHTDRLSVDLFWYASERTITHKKNQSPYDFILGHPILIGDVLEKMFEKSMISIDDFIEKQEKLLYLWRACGITHSLQEILAEGWEEVELCEGEGDELIGSCKMEVLKSEVEALLKFIKSLELK